MGRKYLWIAVFFLWCSGVSYAESEKLTTEDWLRISKQRKIYYILQMMESYNGRGVVFSHSASEYIDLLDRTVSDNPKLKNRDMESVFGALVAQNEAQK